MALKAKITKEQYEALSEALKGEYKQDGDSYIIDLDDGEVAAEMRRARDREKVRADEADRAKKAAEDRLAELEGNDARKRGDIDSIEKSWKDKLDTAEAKGKAAVDGLKSQLESLMLDSAVTKIASEIFIKPNRDARLLRDRVYIDYDGETPVLRVRDKDGKASAMTLEDLRKETVDNPEYDDILSGSKATGSGGGGGNQGGGAAKQPSEYTEAERVKLFKENPTEFRRLFPGT